MSEMAIVGGILVGLAVLYEVAAWGLGFLRRLS